MDPTKIVVREVEVEPKYDQVQTAIKVTKINLRITAKPQAQFQILIKTPAMFQKHVGGVAFTRMDTFCDRQSERWIECTR